MPGPGRGQGSRGDAANHAGMTIIRIPSGPLQGVRLHVAERRWSRTRSLVRALGRRRRVRRPLGA